MAGINVISPNSEFELTLCKPNKLEIGTLSTAKITSIKRVIDDIDSIEFEISEILKDRFTRKNIENPLYNEIHEERLVWLNQSDFFVIKSINEESGTVNKKIVSAVSLEQKLNRINIELEDISIVLIEEDVEDDQLAILGLLYTETGWKVGHIDEGVRFDIVNGEKRKKVRWQESISTTWYSLLTETLADIFACVVFFDTTNKIINIYSLDTLGENLGIYLSNDNYIKSISKQTSTEEIVTRLSLKGKDEINIRSVNPLGKDYVEDYSYFIDNNDMSEELVRALAKHTEIVEINQVEWEKLSTSKGECENQLTKLNSDFYVVCEEIKTLISIKKSYDQVGDTINGEKIQKEIDEKEKVKLDLESKIRDLQVNVLTINEQIQIINTQMDRLYAEDENGNLIFSEELLNELNEFLYYDTYINTSYLTPADLMEGGKREIRRRCKPSVEYNIDSVNFLSRVSNHTDMTFSGELNLGDVVILYDEKSDEEVFLYFVGYEYGVDENTLSITLSTNKTKINNTKNIADYLKKAKNTKDFVDSKSYIFNQVKYNKI